jgi:hypothetical protein
MDGLRMALQSPLRKTLLCALLLGGAALDASAAGLVCTDRWGHRYSMTKPPSDDTENIKCTSADGSPLRKGPARPARAAAPSPGKDVTYAAGTQPPAPVSTAVVKPNKVAAPVEPSSVLGLKNPQPLPPKPPTDVAQVFGFGESALPPGDKASAPLPR